MAITKKDVEHVATLARLELTDAEKELYTGQLKRILDHVEALSKADTSGVPPTTYTVPLAKRVREDAAGAPLSLEKTLQNAPAKEDGCFKVPKVIE